MAYNTTYTIAEIEKMANAKGLTLGGIRKRLDAGMTLDVALSKPVHPTSGVYVTIFNTQKTLAEWARDCKVSEESFRKAISKRRSAGMSPSEAVAEYIWKHYLKNSYDGVLKPKLDKVAKRIFTADDAFQLVLKDAKHGTKHDTQC